MLKESFDFCMRKSTSFFRDAQPQTVKDPVSYSQEIPEDDEVRRTPVHTHQ
jgi:hypothetical protein